MPESRQPQRQILPIHDPQHVGVTAYDAKDPAASFPPIEPLRPPEGALNVLVSLFVDGNKGGEGRVDATVPMAFSADETTDVGSDTATPVTDDLAPDETKFDGRVLWVEIDVLEDAKDSDHLIHRRSLSGSQWRGSSRLG